MKELQVRGLSAGLTSRKPQVDEDQKRLQRAERDHRSQKEQDLQIQAGSAADPIFHPHLQELTPAALLQPPQLVNEVHMTQLDTLIQRTVRPEPLPALPPREPLRLHSEWAGKSRFVCPMTFSRLPFPMMLTCTLSEWGTTLPPRAMMPQNWPEQWAAVKCAHAVSQTRGGFRSPSGPNYRPTVSAFPQQQPWADPTYQRPKPVNPRKQPTTETPSPLRTLPMGWIPLEQRPKLGQAIANLQGLPAGGSAQQQPEEPMDESASHIAASEAGASETQSEMRDRQAGEGILMSSPSTVQGTGDEDDDEYNDEEESDEDEDEEESG